MQGFDLSIYGNEFIIGKKNALTFTREAKKSDDRKRNKYFENDKNTTFEALPPSCVFGGSVGVRASCPKVGVSE